MRRRRRLVYRPLGYGLLPSPPRATISQGRINDLLQEYERIQNPTAHWEHKTCPTCSERFLVRRCEASRRVYCKPACRRRRKKEVS